MSEGLSIGRPRFVTLDDALAWHEIAIAQYGGSPGIRDMGLLKSALAQPQQGFGGQFAHAFPFEMAAAYAYHIAKNHPFFDGNKRTSLMCCGGFLRMNGWDLDSVMVEAADAIIDLVEDRRDKRSFAQWLAEHTRQRPSMELRDFFLAIDPAKFMQVFTAIRPDADGNKPDEFQATADELVQAVPLVRTLLDVNREAVARKDEPRRMTATAVILTIAALHRLAEDLGYEW